MIRVFNRKSSGDLTNFVDETRWQIGTGGTSNLVSSQGYDTTSLTVGSGTTYDIVRPVVKWRWSYPTAGVTTALAEGGTPSNDEVKTAMAYTYYTGDAALMVEKIITTLPAVSTGQNGSNSSNTRSVYMDESGRRLWQKTEAGIIDYIGYENGRIKYRVQDADTSLTGSGEFFENITIPTGFGSDGSGDEMQRVTTIETDDIPGGITTAHNGDVSDTSLVVLADRRIVRISVPLKSGSTWYGPASYAVMNQAGQTECSATVALSGGSTTDDPDTWIDETSSDAFDPFDSGFTDGSLFRVTTNIFNENGARLEEARMYFDIPSSGVGSEGTNYDTTEYLYDDMGRRVGVRDATETITRTTYDAIGRVNASYVGTIDNDSGTFDVSFESSGTSDMR